jgi:1-acyl-sn-glycerol-3-phosphate acyltransferase
MNYFFVIAPLFIQKAIWPISRFTLWFFCNLKINGLENLNNIDKKQKVIFAANHTSELDPFIPSTCLPFFSQYSPMFCVTKGKSFYDESGFRQIFYGGLLFKLIGGQVVYSGHKDYEISLKNHFNLINQGYSDLIFPEGGISKTDQLYEAKGGIAYLAEKTNSLIVPIGISGLRRMSLSDLFLKRRNVVVNFGKPIPQEVLKTKVIRQSRYNVNYYKNEAKYVMDEIYKLIV